MSHDEHSTTKFKKAVQTALVLIGLAADIKGLLQLNQGDYGLAPIALLLAGVGGLVVMCAYLAFKRTGPLVANGKGTWKYQRLRPWALACLVLIPAVSFGFVAGSLYQRSQLPKKLVVLVAKFDGDDASKYRVTDTILTNLRSALARYDDVQVDYLDQTITATAGSGTARVEGKEHNAKIVIWGWYGDSDITPLSVNFEVLGEPREFPTFGQEAQGAIRLASRSELDRFTLQTRLSKEMNYLTLFTVGMVRYEAADWSGAVSPFSDALSQTAERVPELDQSIVYFYRGSAYQFEFHLDQAIDDFSQAIALNPKFTEAYGNRGDSFGAKGDFDHGIADFDRVIQLDPSSALAYNGLGNIYHDQGNLDQAIAEFTRAIQLDPNLAFAYVNRGNSFDDNGKVELAIVDYDRAIQLAPGFFGGYHNRCIAYDRKGDFDQAISDCSKAVELAPTYALAYESRGISYFHRGMKPQAVTDFETYLRLWPAAPDHDLVNQLIGKLR